MVAAGSGWRDRVHGGEVVMTFEAWLKHIGYEHFAMQPAPVVKRALHMAWQASREHQSDCTCPNKGGPDCEFFDMVTDECLYGHI